MDAAAEPAPVASGYEATPIWAAGAPAVPVGGTPMPSAPAPRSSRLKLGIVAAVSAIIVIGGGVAVAQAASDSASTQDNRGPGGNGQGFPGGGRGGNGAQGGAPGANGAQGFPGGGAFTRGGGVNAVVGALHGDFVVKNGSGQYVTERLQSGTVTAVSATSITAKSEDGHATTFVVSADTKVDNGAAKISDVKQGDSVTVIGLVSGDTATATEITDLALMRQGNGGFGGNGGPGGNRQRPSGAPQPTRTT
ncbi:hypothetical protein [Dactylosporangium darangshiense]|uniref:hypothetical protein n=1 Tax=Dactylosporangium darangshiense TaxID=579108 RepID=UPI0031E78E62